MEGCYEQLKKRIDMLKAQSKDPFFTEYMQKLSQRLQNEKQQIDLIGADLERSYQMYLQRQGMSQSQPEQQGEVKQAQETRQFTEVLQAENVRTTQKEMIQEKTLSRETVYNQPVRAPKKDKEFVVGIGLFSVIGVFFILTAFVMLGMYFMTGFIKGMLLYVMALVVWILAEVLVRKKSQTLSLILSSIGIAGLYIATMINFVFLQNFNEPVTGIVLAVVTILVFAVNRKKQLGIIQMAAVAISTWVFAVNCSDAIIGIELDSFQIFMAVYLVASMLILELVLCRMSTKGGNNAGLLTTFGVSMAVCVFSCISFFRGEEMTVTVLRAVVMGVTLLFAGLAFWMMRNSNLKWSQVYFVSAVTLILYVFGGSELEITIALLTLLFAVKILRSKYIRVCDVIVTILTAIYCLTLGDGVHQYILLGGLVLSVACLHYWQTCFELIVTITVVLFITINMDNVLKIPVVIAVMWLAVVLFNQIERFRDKAIDVFNVLVLLGMGICYLSVAANPYEDYKIVYLILTILGLGIIAFIFQEKNHLGVARGIVVTGFLIYMVLIVPFEADIVNSILLMLIGLGSVGFGFYNSDKVQRICGLILAMLVCFKITLFDFSGEDSLQKMLLFLCAGIVSLIISGIYVLLDKKYNKES